MNVSRFAQALYKWRWLVLATVVVASLASYLITRALPRTYVSRTTLMVGQVLQSSDPSPADISTGKMLAQNYADLAKREPILRATLEALGLGWDWTVLQKMVSSRAIPGTTVVEIAVTDTDPRRAKVFVSEISNQLILQSPAGTNPQKEADRQFVLNQMQELQTSIQKGQEQIRELDDVIAKATSARQIEDAHNQQLATQAQISTWQAMYAQLGVVLQQGAPNSLSTVEPAMDAQPVSSRALLNVSVAAVIGLVLASGAGLALEFMDDTLKTSNDVRHVLNLSSLGRIPRIADGDDHSRLVMATDPRSPTAEAFRMLRTNLQYGPGTRVLRTLMLTSPNPGEGKSLIAANLAICVAQSGKGVVLVDADLRRPSLHKIFDLRNEAGLSSVLEKAQVNLDDVVQTTSIENLWVLTAGPLPDNPSELFRSKQMVELVNSLQQHADVVIFDSPPVMAVSDAIVLAPHMDGTLLVIDSGSTRQQAARRSKESLEAAKARLAGAVLNRWSTREGGYYYHYYYGEDGKRLRQPANAKPAVAGAAEPASLRLRKLSEASPQIAQTNLVDRSALRPLPEPRPTAPPPESRPLALPKSRPAALPASRSHPLPERKLIPLPTRPRAVIAPAVEQAARTAGDYAKTSAARTRVPSLSTSDLRGLASKVTQLAKNNRGLAILGASACVILIAAFGLSLAGRQAGQGYEAPTAAFVGAPLTTKTPGVVDTATPESDIRGTGVAQRQTEEAQGRSSAATGTAEVIATVTQSAINALAAQQALGLISCDRIDYAILEAPLDITGVISSEANVELMWRVRNRAVSPNCKWGSNGQETKLLRAVEVGGQLRNSMSVKLEWIDNDEYYLSLNTLLGPGKYDLRWRLVLPKTNLPSGPELAASVVVAAPTLTPTPTLTREPTFIPVPTPTFCPTKVYRCNCKKECSGRNCTTVCDECTRQECS